MSERILLERERVPLHTFIKLHLVKFTVYSGLKKFQYSGCVLIKFVSMCYCKYLGLRTVIIKQFYFCFHCSFKPHHLSSFIYDFNDKYHPQDFSNAFKTNKWTKKQKEQMKSVYIPKHSICSVFDYIQIELTIKTTNLI